MGKQFGDPKPHWGKTRAELHARLQERALIAVAFDEIIHNRIPASHGEATEPSAEWGFLTST